MKSTSLSGGISVSKSLQDAYHNCNRVGPVILILIHSGYRWWCSHYFSINYAHFIFALFFLCSFNAFPSTFCGDRADNLMFPLNLTHMWKAIFFWSILKILFRIIFISSVRQSSSVGSQECVFQMCAFFFISERRTSWFLFIRTPWPLGTASYEGHRQTAGLLWKGVSVTYWCYNHVE